MDNIKNNLALIQNKSELLAFLHKQFNENQKSAEGCNIMVKSFDSWNKETKIDKIKILCKLTREQGKLNQKLILILMNYILGGSFSTDLAKTAMNMGASGEEVLQEMMRQKMNGEI